MMEFTITELTDAAQGHQTPAFVRLKLAYLKKDRKFEKIVGNVSNFLISNRFYQEGFWSIKTSGLVCSIDPKKISDATPIVHSIGDWE